MRGRACSVERAVHLFQRRATTRPRPQRVGAPPVALGDSRLAGSVKNDPNEKLAEPLNPPPHSIDGRCSARAAALSLSLDAGIIQERSLSQRLSKPELGHDLGREKFKLLQGLVAGDQSPVEEPNQVIERYLL